jgi:hypothetical protein
VWVVQECILARDLQFQLADGILPTKLLEIAFDTVRSLDMVGPRGSYPFDTRVLGHEALRNFQLFYHRRRRISRGSMHSDLSLLCCVIDLTQGRDCKDSRDRLYAMLAVAEDNLGIDPDYTVPLSVVFNNFATQLLLTGDLTVLHVSGIRPNHNPSLSSFAPTVADWVGMTSRLNAPELGFCAANIFPASVRLNAANTVSLKGVRVDAINRIQDVAPRFIYHAPRSHRGLKVHEDFAPWFTHRQKFADASVNARPKFKSPYIGSSLREILRRTMLLDTTDTSCHRSGEEPTADFADFDVDSNVGKFSALDINTFYKNRLFFETEQGYFGLGPSWMKPDDQVVIFDGGTTPFILRNVGSKKRKSGDTWQLVGDCFLLGWMHGDYFGHTVIDEAPPKTQDDKEESIGENKSYLVKKYFDMLSLVKRYLGNKDLGKKYLIKESFILV